MHLRFARNWHTLAAVPDELVGKQYPLSRGMTRIKSCSIFLGSVCLGQVEAFERRVTCVSTTTPYAMPNAVPNTTLAVFLATPGSVRSWSIVRGTRPPKFFDDFFARAHDGFCFVAEESRGADLLLDFGGIRVGQIFGRGIFLEKSFCDLVDHDVRALRGEDCGDQQLECVACASAQVAPG